MTSRKTGSTLQSTARAGVAIIVATSFTFAPILPAAAQPFDGDHGQTATPIQHIILIIGENRTFNHIRHLSPKP